jgi:hypothetical protein
MRRHSVITAALVFILVAPLFSA